MAAWDTGKLSNLPINTKVIIAEYGLEAKDNYLVFPVSCISCILYFHKVDFKQADMPKHEDPQ